MVKGLLVISKLLERCQLFLMILHCGDMSECPFSNLGSTDRLGQIEDVTLDIVREVEEGNYLGDAGAGDAFQSSDGCLGSDLAGVEKFLPL